MIRDVKLCLPSSVPYFYHKKNILKEAAGPSRITETWGELRFNPQFRANSARFSLDDKNCNQLADT